MERRRTASRLTLVFALAWALAGLAGCPRQMAVPGSTGTTGSGQLPFDRVSDGNGVSPTEAFAFEGFPAGTELTIRLRSALSSANSRVGDSFEAELDDPVVIGGKMVAQRGALVTGTVVDTKSSVGQGPGYLRVTLASIALNGKPVPVQTSSIFTKGGSYEKRTTATTDGSRAGDKVGMPEALAGYGLGTRSSSSTTAGDVRFSTGHRFTFRLIQPLHL